MKKSTLSIVASIAAMVVLGSIQAASAQETEIYTTSGNSGNSQNIVYVPGSGLTLGTTTGRILPEAGSSTGPVDNNVTIHFSTLTEAPGSAYHDFGAFATEEISGGSFYVEDNTTHADLLSGSFASDSILQVTSSGGVSTLLLLDDVNYDSTSYITGQPLDYLLTGGAIAVTGQITSSPSPILPAPATEFGSFVASDSIDFYATTTTTTSTPEPASFATFGIGALVLLSLVAVAKRRSSVHSL